MVWRQAESTRGRIRSGGTNNNHLNGASSSSSLSRRICRIAGYVCLFVLIFHLGRITTEVSRIGETSGKYNTGSGDPQTKVMKSEVIFDFPPTVKDVLVNVGSSVDPMMLGEQYGPCARTIAIEPITPCTIPENPQLTVLQAAVSDHAGIQKMKYYNGNGVSSSLATASFTEFWNDPTVNKRYGEIFLVPAVTLTEVITAIPETSKVRLLKTDMQGYDFTSLQAAGPSIVDRISHVITEVWFDDIHSYNVRNDLCRDFIPYMSHLGYTLVNIQKYPPEQFSLQRIMEKCSRQIQTRPVRPAINETVGRNEGDAFWIRNDTIGEPFPIHIRLPEFKPNFSENDYQECAAN